MFHFSYTLPLMWFFTFVLSQFDGKPNKNQISHDFVLKKWTPRWILPYFVIFYLFFIFFIFCSRTQDSLPVGIERLKNCPQQSLLWEFFEILSCFHTCYKASPETQSLTITVFVHASHLLYLRWSETNLRCTKKMQSENKVCFMII